MCAHTRRVQYCFAISYDPLATTRNMQYASRTWIQKLHAHARSLRVHGAGVSNPGARSRSRPRVPPLQFRGSGAPRSAGDKQYVGCWDFIPKKYGSRLPEPNPHPWGGGADLRTFHAWYKNPKPTYSRQMWISVLFCLAPLF